MCKNDPNGQNGLSNDEIQFLMTEHLEYSKQVDGIVKFAATVTGALLAVAFSDRIPNGYLIALSPLLVLWPMHSLAMNKNCNMVRIATYVRAFSGHKWQYEKRLKKFRNEMNRKKDEQGDCSNQEKQSTGAILKRLWASYQFANNGIFIILGFLSITCSFILAVKELPSTKLSQAGILKPAQEWIWLWPLFIPLLSLILWFVYCLKNKSKMRLGGMGEKLEDTCFKLWKEISPEDRKETYGDGSGRSNLDV